MGGPSQHMNDQGQIDQLRYRRILRFFAGVIANIIWWDLMVGRLPVARQRAVSSRPQRLRDLAREFRGLAIEMGGVMIKLGQFLSSRVDVLPIEVTQELQGLQDEVPPADNEQVFGLLREQLGDLNRRFVNIERQPLAAASLGQVYRARLRPAGEAEVARVVIKVQRPGIEHLVRTDLAALRVVARWVMRYKPIRKRANVPALLEEFARTLWQELDYRAEADNAEQFAAIHADNPRIQIPRVYREHSTSRVVVLEDVEALKIGDTAALAARASTPRTWPTCCWRRTSSRSSWPSSSTLTPTPAICSFARGRRPTGTTPRRPSNLSLSTSAWPCACPRRWARACARCSSASPSATRANW